LFNDILLNKEGDNMIIDLEIEEIKSIENLIISRINDLRDRLTDDTDKEEELKAIIRDYKRIIQKIDEQLTVSR
jgi:hypothetical protein